MVRSVHLTERQQEVVDKLRNGWVLESRLTIDGGWNLRGPDRGWLTVNGNTANALYDKKVIRQVSRLFPTAVYELTEAYRA